MDVEDEFHWSHTWSGHLGFEGPPSRSFIVIIFACGGAELAQFIHIIHSPDLQQAANLALCLQPPCKNTVSFQIKLMLCLQWGRRHLGDVSEISEPFGTSQRDDFQFWSTLYERCSQKKKWRGDFSHFRVVCLTHWTDICVTGKILVNFGKTQGAFKTFKAISFKIPIA